MLDRIAEVLIAQLKLPENTVITENTDFIRDLRADSLDIVELVAAFEEEYGIRIDDEDIGKLSTVGDVMEYIRRR